jgi:hypothetical protein
LGLYWWIYAPSYASSNKTKFIQTVLPTQTFMLYIGTFFNMQCYFQPLTTQIWTISVKYQLLNWVGKSSYQFFQVNRYRLIVSLTKQLKYMDVSNHTKPSTNISVQNCSLLNQVRQKPIKT